MTRISIIGFAILSCVMVGHARGQGAPIPPLVVPQGAGVNIHFTDPQPGEMEMLKAGGFKWIRMDFSWAAIEKQKGVYDFSEYERLLAALDKAGIHAMLILDYSNPLYDGGVSPHTDEGRAAFAKWAAASAQHFKGRGVMWEMYNEPNGFWKPVPKVDDFVKLALAVGQAFRTSAPQETLVGPGLSGFDNTWFEACFKAGLLEYWSAVTVHPYRQSAPETAAEDYRHLRAMIARYAPKGKTIPVLSGEWGYSSVWAGMNSETQGKMLPRQWLTNISNDVPLSIWYDWHDDGPDPHEPEHHFGTVLNPYHKGRDPVYDPKPAYLAAKAYTTQLDGFAFNKRLLVGSGDDFVLLFEKGPDVKLVAWTSSATPHPITIPASAGAFSAVSFKGEKLPNLTADAKGLTVTVNDGPQYLTPEKPNDLLRVAGAWARLPFEIRADAPKAVNVESSFTNPLAAPVSVNDGTGAHAVAPGQALKLNHTVNLTRSVAPVPVRIEWDFNGTKLSQQTEVIASNPIAAGVLPPTGESLIVKVENPSTQPLDGKVVVTDEAGKPIVPATEVKVAAGGETLVRFPFPRSTPPATTHASTKPASQSVPHPATRRFVLKVLDAKGAEILSKPAVRFVPVEFTLANLVATPEGDANVASEQSLAAAQPPDGPPAPGATSIQVNYSFAAGWKYLCVQPKTPELRKIEGKPTALGIWVHGDGSGNIARMRIVDSTGQTFQPDGPPINWKDWKYLQFPLDGKRAGHWGGAADGVIHYPISLDTIFLIDSATRSKTSGTIFLSTPTLIYHD